MLVADFKEKMSYRFPDEFLDSIPDYCPDDRCGSPMEMSEALTGLKCSNPKCPTKVANRLVAIMNMLGIKDLGLARANDFISTYDIVNPLEIFSYDIKYGLPLGKSTSMEVSKKISDQLQNKRKFTLWEYVRIANLPNIQNSALAIFGEFDDLDKAYEKIEEGGVSYIAQKLGISTDNDEISLRAIKVYTSLMTYKSDLFTSLPFVEIIRTHDSEMRTLKVVCSDEVGGGFKTKASFYAYMNNKYSNLHFEFLNSASKSIDYLIWAGADGTTARVTNKVAKIRKYNEAYELHKQNGVLKDNEHYIPIMTATQFCDEMDRLMIYDN